MSQQWSTTARAGTGRQSALDFDPSVTCGRVTNRIGSVLEGRLILGIVVVAGVFGLIRFAGHIAQQDQAHSSADSLAFVSVDHYEVVRIWVPAPLVELARSPARSVVTRSHADLRRFLENSHEQALWYAFTNRMYQRDGSYSDCTYLRHPYDDPVLLPELAHLLAGVHNRPPEWEIGVYAHTSFGVVPDQLVKREWRLVVGQLLDDLYHRSAEFPAP
jgi:hypothetical protein